MVLKVIKRDGREEEFDPDKIARVTTSSGLRSQEGLGLALVIDRWAKSLNKEKLTTMEIRNKVIEELKKTNAYVANLFIWYERGKDKIATDSK